MDWRDVLRERGVPVWRGASVVEVTSGATFLCVQEPDEEGGFNTAPDPVEYGYEGKRLAGSGYVGLGDVVVNLSDPDTQPAYLRRLAVRLGCPEGVAQEGVRFYQVMRGLWILDAGFVHLSFRAQWSRGFERLGTNNRLLALALAWPKEGV